MKDIKQRWRDVDVQFLAANADWSPLILLRLADNLDKKWFDYCDVLTVRAMRDYIVGLSRQRFTVNIDSDAQNEIDRFVTVCADSIADSVLADEENLT